MQLEWRPARKASLVAVRLICPTQHNTNKEVRKDVTVECKYRIVSAIHFKERNGVVVTSGV